VQLAGKELQLQAVKETQVLIENDLGLNAQVLRRIIFQGQHHMHGKMSKSCTRNAAHSKCPRRCCAAVLRALMMFEN
jgi:hypothetical protein